MAHQDNRSALIQDILNGGQCRFDAFCICNRTGHLVLGNIEINAHDHALTLHVDIAHSFLAHWSLLQKNF